MSPSVCAAKPAKELQAILDQADLPSMPGATLRILQLAGNPTATLDQLADAVAVDPTLSARILGLANSAYYNRGRVFVAVARAVAHLGMAQIRSLALATHLFTFKPKSSPHCFDYGRFWRGCLTCATAAKLLATQLRSADPEEAFAAGLLQDLGVLALQRARADTYEHIWRQHAESSLPLDQLESRQLGYSHADVGAAIAAHWGLPETIGNAIHRHHQPGDDALARLCFLADMVHAAIYESRLVTGVELAQVLRAYRCHDVAVLNAIEAELPRISEACGCPSWDADAEEHLKDRVRDLLLAERGNTVSAR